MRYALCAISIAATPKGTGERDAPATRDNSVRVARPAKPVADQFRIAFHIKHALYTFSPLILIYTSQSESIAGCPHSSVGRWWCLLRLHNLAPSNLSLAHIRNQVCTHTRDATRMLKYASARESLTAQVFHFVPQRSRARVRLCVCLNQRTLSEKPIRVRSQLQICIHDRITPRARSPGPRPQARARTHARRDLEAKNVIYARRRHKLTRSRTDTDTRARAPIVRIRSAACKCIRVCL